METFRAANVREAGFVSVGAWALLIVSSSLFLIGCGSGSQTDKPAASAQQGEQPPGTPPRAPTASQAPFVPVDACTLLTKGDVEGMAGKPVLDGRKEEVGPLVLCSFGDPTAPQVGGRALSQVLTLSVMTGQEGAYFAGPVAQAKDSFLMARKNAASVEAVAGLGEDAYWDKILRKLSLVKGKHLVDVVVESGGDSLKLARAAAAKAVERLP